MNETLHNALGRWPSNPSDVARDGTGHRQLYERVTFGGDDEHPSAFSVFKVTGRDYPSEKVFIPPYFIPPGSSRLTQSFSAAIHRPQHAVRENVSTQGQGGHVADGGDVNIDPAIQEVRLPMSKQPKDLSNTARLKSPARQTAHVNQRSPSPRTDPPDLKRQREMNWSHSGRQSFHAMVNAPGYVNRYRLASSKYQRLMSYLQQPDVEPLNEDGSKDHQTKYQAANWVLRNGELYRKAEQKGGVGGSGLRKHLNVDEVWDVLTAEHLRTDHLGRDRLRKVLERRYIGYTLQEIMFVLRECKSCNGRTKGLTDAQRDEQRNAELVDGDRPGNGNHQASTGGPEAQREKRQTSNFMFF